MSCDPTSPPSAYPFASISSKNEKNPHSPPAFLHQDPLSPTSTSSPYILSSTDPFRNKRRVGKGPLTISPPAPARRRSSAHALVVSPATTPKYRTKFHASRPRASPYTPSSVSFSITPRRASFAPTLAEVDIFPPTPRRCSMTPRSPPSFTVIAEFPSQTRSSVGSEIALCLGTFETLPASFQPQPSPPCSPNPSPIYAAFPAGSQSFHSSAAATRAARIQSGSCTTPPRSPLSATSRNSPYDSKPIRQGPMSPGSAPKKAKEFLGVGGNDVVRMKSSRSSKSSSPAETQASKAAKERRKKAEKARPLPYAKKLEIDEFFGKEVKPHRSKAYPSSSNDAKWTGSAAERNVGEGRGVEHIGEDGTVWLDVEEEQEWAWLMSEVGRGAQPLPYWPQQFSSHLHPSTAVARNPLPSFDEERDPLDSSLEPSYDSPLQLQFPLSSTTDEEEAWTVPTKIISVLDMINSSPPLPSIDDRSDAGSDTGVSVSSRKEKKRPKPLRLFGSSSPAKPQPSLPRNISSSTHRSATSLHVAQGKDEFLSSAFRPSSLPSPTLSTYTDAGHALDPLTPDDDLETSRPSFSLARSRTRSGGSRKSMGTKEPVEKEKKAGFGAIRGFFKKVGGGDGKH